MPVPAGIDASAVGDDDPPVRRLVADFVAREVAPIVAGLDTDARFPAELYRSMAELDLFGITIAQRYGGAGCRALDYLHVMEGLGFGYASVADQCGLVELVATLLAEHGTDAQRQRYLTPLLAAVRFCAYALTEPQAGSDLAAVSTSAQRDGDSDGDSDGGGWRLTGEKVFIHNAPVADFAVVLARTDPEAGRAGLTVFLVDLDSPGIERTYRERKTAQRASQVGGLQFDAAPAAPLGEEGAGFAAMTGVLAKGRLGIAGLSLGISRAALDVRR